MLTAINPVVYRSGRYALMNEGFRDDSGSVLAPDADFAGYEADVDDAGMQGARILATSEGPRRPPPSPFPRIAPASRRSNSEKR